MKHSRRFKMKTVYPILLTSLLAITTTTWAEKSADTHNHENETAEEHAKHADEHEHKGETPEEHAKHADKDNHAEHGHEGETPEEHAKHANEHEGHDHEGHEHGKPHHGGIVSEVDDIHHELVTEEGKLVLYAEGLPEGEALKAVKVRLSILQGKEKQDIDMALAEDDQHRFEADTDIQLVEGNKVVALIRIEGQKPRMARFEIPAKSAE
jgi:hypothetical protein